MNRNNDLKYCYYFGANFTEGWCMIDYRLHYREKNGVSGLMNFCEKK